MYKEFGFLLEEQQDKEAGYKVLFAYLYRELFSSSILSTATHSYWPQMLFQVALDQM